MGLETTSLIVSEELTRRARSLEWGLVNGFLASAGIEARTSRVLR